MLHTCLPVWELGLETDCRFHMKEVQMQKYTVRENEAWRCFKGITAGPSFLLVADAQYLLMQVLSQKSQCNFSCFLLFRDLTYRLHSY